MILIKETTFSKQEILVYDILFLFGVIFTFGAQILTDFGLSSGKIYEANPISRYLIGIGFMQIGALGLYTILFVGIKKFCLKSKNIETQLLYPGLMVVILLMALYDFLHDLILLRILGVI